MHNSAAQVPQFTVTSGKSTLVGEFGAVEGKQSYLVAGLAEREAVDRSGLRGYCNPVLKGTAITSPRPPPPVLLLYLELTDQTVILTAENELIIYKIIFAMLV